MFGIKWLVRVIDRYEMTDELTKRKRTRAGHRGVATRRVAEAEALLATPLILSD